MDKVSGRQLAGNSPVQPQKLRQNQHSAALKQRRHKILKVLPQGAVKGRNANHQADAGKKSIISHVFVCVFVQSSL